MELNEESNEKRLRTHSVANVFGLPLFCQYGLGEGAGFGAWRELAANEMATEWVLEEKCANFPILYHWRVLPAPKSIPMNDEQIKKLDQTVQFWENSSAVRNRLEEVHRSSAYLVLLSEFVPQNLLEWQSAQFKKGQEASDLAIAFVERNLGPTNAFMNARGFVHFDTHFENIMTDGQLLYFTDFGLALSSKFELTGDEIEFLKQHGSYDQCRSAVGYLHCLTTSFLGQDQWKENLHEYLKTAQPRVAPTIAAVIKKYAPMGLAFLDFSQALRTRSKHTPYPADHLERLMSDAVVGQLG